MTWTAASERRERCPAGTRFVNDQGLPDREACDHALRRLYDHDTLPARGWVRGRSNTRIVEHGDGVGKVDAVLPEVGERFGRIPLEVHAKVYAQSCTVAT